MKKEDSHIGIWDVSTTPSANVSADKFARPSASAKVEPSDSASPTPMKPLMTSTKVPLSSASPSRTKWHAALSSTLRWSTNSSTHSLLFRASTDTPGATQTFGARLTVDAVSSIANSSTAELDTPSLNRVATFPSPEKLAITDFAQDVANELLHGGFTHLFIKFLIIIFLSLINFFACIDVSMHSQGHIEERYSSVP